MEIKVLGPGCKNCVTLDKIAHEVVQEMGLTATFEKVEDYAAIASYGVMSTPALVLDGKVLFSGRVPTPNHLKELISEELSTKG
ncbi:MAG: thioredoxin family protein [Actinomycetes bacterium]